MHSSLVFVVFIPSCAYVKLPPKKIAQPSCYAFIFCLGKIFSATLPQGTFKDALLKDRERRKALVRTRDLSIRNPIGYHLNYHGPHITDKFELLLFKELMQFISLLSFFVVAPLLRLR